jgi:hypothetical protein
VPTAIDFAAAVDDAFGGGCLASPPKRLSPPNGDDYYFLSSLFSFCVLKREIERSKSIEASISLSTR